MKTVLRSHMDATHDQGPSCCQDPWNKLTRCGLRCLFKAQREFGRAEKKERGARCTSQAPPLLRQRKPYLTGSPPSRQERRYRQECRLAGLYRESRRDSSSTNVQTKRIGYTPRRL